MVNYLQKIEDKTCIRFKPRNDEIDYIEIVNQDWCHSNLGKIGNLIFNLIKYSTDLW